MNRFRWLSFVAVLLFLAVPLVAADAGDGLDADAADYSKTFGVSVDEAKRRLQLQRVVSRLEGEVAEAEAETFAGMWIEHTPRFRVVARFTSPDAEQRLLARAAAGPLAGLVETRSARFSMAELDRKQKDAHDRAGRASVPVESRIDVANNRVEVITVDDKKLNAAARMPEGVAVQRVKQLSTGDNLPELLGGYGLSSGTAGFGVIAPSGETGISTSGHNDDNEYFNGIWLPFRNQKMSGDQEVQWNSTCDRVYVSNRIYTGIDVRSITGTQHRSNQTIGTYLCKYGKATYRTCGTLADKNISLMSGYNNTFIRVNNSNGGTLRGPGDSGAPWFVENLAYGIHWGSWGGDPNDALYMAINYITAIGVNVLTYDPGPVCNLTPHASFTYSASNNFGAYTFDASGSYDPDGSIASYTWDFGDGEVVTTTSPTISHFFGPGQFQVVLTVTDNEGKTSYAWVWISTCGGPGQMECPI